MSVVHAGAVLVVGGAVALCAVAKHADKYTPEFIRGAGPFRWNATALELLTANILACQREPFWSEVTYIAARQRKPDFKRKKLVIL